DANPRITASYLLVIVDLRTPTRLSELPRPWFWLMIALSLCSGQSPLIALAGKPNTITSRVVSLIVAPSPNTLATLSWSFHWFLASTLLNVRAMAPLGSFLAPIISPFPPALLCTSATISGADLLLCALVPSSQVTSTSRDLLAGSCGASCAGLAT